MCDFIIAGRGLAGTTLGLTLIRKGYKVLVIDDPRLSNTSRIAAGIVNPLAFRRFNPAWKAIEFINFLKKFYASFSLDTPLYNEVAMYKPYGSAEEIASWKKSGLDYFLGEDTVLPPPVINPLGCLNIRHCGWLNLPSYLEAGKKLFETSGSLLNERFDYDRLVVNNEGVKYDKFHASKIIFCEGYLAAMQNRWFRNLPFLLTKGEILDIEIPGLQADYILNRNVFLLPVGDGKYKTGATFKWDVMDEEITLQAREDLLLKLEANIRTEVNIISQNAGVRPTIKDRRPLIGLHPEHPALAIFNGMGSKGAMYAPLLADQLADHLVNPGSPLFPEADIKRFSFSFPEL